MLLCHELISFVCTCGICKWNDGDFHQVVPISYTGPHHSATSMGELRIDMNVFLEHSIIIIQVASLASPHLPT